MKAEQVKCGKCRSQLVKEYESHENFLGSSRLKAVASKNRPLDGPGNMLPCSVGATSITFKLNAKNASRISKIIDSKNVS